MKSRLFTEAKKTSQWVDTTHQLNAMAIESTALCVLMQLDSHCSHNTEKTKKTASKLLNKIRDNGTGLSELQELANTAFDDDQNRKLFLELVDGYNHCCRVVKQYETSQPKVSYTPKP